MSVRIRLKFERDRIQLAIAGSGIQLHGPPDIQEFAVHEMFTP